MELDHTLILDRIDWLAEKGGPIIMIIAALSVLTITMFIAKLLHYWRLGMFNLASADTAVVAWERQDLSKAQAALTAMKGCMPETLMAAMGVGGRHTLGNAGREAGAVRTAQNFLARARSGFRIFELIITAAPLLGLLGTVLGMIEAFKRIEESGNRVDPGLLAGGIWEALLTTAAGMVVALLSLAAFNVLEAVMERTRQKLEDRSNRVLNVPIGAVVAE